MFTCGQRTAFSTIKGSPLTLNFSAARVEKVLIFTGVPLLKEEPVNREKFLFFPQRCFCQEVSWPRELNVWQSLRKTWGYLVALEPCEVVYAELENLER